MGNNNNEREKDQKLSINANPSGTLEIVEYFNKMAATMSRVEKEKTKQKPKTR